MGNVIRIAPNPVNGAYDFVKEWIEYADQGGENIFFSFFCYFLSFNHLYECEQLWHTENGRPICSKGSLARRKIEAFLRHVMFDEFGERLTTTVTDAEFELLFSVNQRRAPATYWRNNPPEGSEGIVREFSDADEMRVKTAIALFKIYDVRNNLFHGDKHPSDKDCRDVKLVRASNAVLRRFLRECAGKGLGIYHWWLVEEHGSSLCGEEV